MGELLKQFNAQGQRTDALPDGAVRKLTQSEAARAAGISERQEGHRRPRRQRTRREIRGGYRSGEAGAKRRLAGEYDAAQERGEIVGQRTAQKKNPCRAPRLGDGARP
jgi:hypothetical protein